MSTASYDPDNIFARILRGELPCHKVHEDEDTLVFMDIMPRGEGHALVVPKRPSRNLLDAEPQCLAAVMRTTQELAKAAMTAFGADGVTLHQFNESAGGQMVFHLHFHVIPRFEGVPLKPHTGIMEKPEVLAEHAERLRKAMEAGN